MRKEFSKNLIELAQKDENIFVITGDIGFGVLDEFRKKFPHRFLNAGIREQSMIGISAGMALEGLKPYVYAITPFLIERAFEQIKLDIDQQNLNVKLIGYADYPGAGPTHFELDGPKLMSLLKNTQSYFPINSEETRKYMVESYNLNKPAFISLKRDKTR